MANIPENTSYEKGLGSILGSSSEDILKQISEILSKAPTATKTPASTNFRLAPPTPSINTEITAGVNQPYAPSEPGSKTPVSEYNTQASQIGLPEMQFAQPSQVVPTLVPPTEKTQIVTAPGVFDDGGQYLVEEGSPGSYLKNERALITPEMKRLMLNGLSPRNFEVDHIVPLWVGGADTLENVEVMPKAEHAKKTSIQAVPYTLFYYSQLLQRDPKSLFPDEKAALANADPEVLDHLKKDPYTRQKARIDMDGWKSHSSTNIPDLDEYGKIDPSVALDVYKSWHEVQGAGIMGWLKEIPAAANQIGGAIGKTAEEVFSAVPVVGPAALGALKGLVSGYSAGWAQKVSPELFETDLTAARQRVSKVTGQEVMLDETTKKIEGVAMGIGEILGNVVGFGGAFKKISDLMFGTAGAEGIKGMNVVSRTLSRFGKGAQTAEEVSKAAANTAKIGKEVANVSKGAGPVIAEMMPTISAGIKNGELLVSTGIHQGARSAKVVNILKNIGAFEVLGQISAPEGDNKFFSMEGRGKRAIYDALFGGLIGYQSHSARGYASVFGSSLWISLVQGDDTKDAFTNAAIITGMHGIAHKQARFSEKMRDAWEKKAPEMAQNGAEYVAQHKLWLLGLAPEPEGVSRYVNEGAIPENYRGMPKEVKTRFEKEGNKFRARVIEKIENMIDNQITLSRDKKSFKTGWEETEVKKIHDEYNVVLGILDKSILPKEIRREADRKDLKQFITSMKVEERARDFSPSEVARRRLDEIGPDGFINKRSNDKRAKPTPEESFELGQDVPIGTAVTTGYGWGISPLKSENYHVTREAHSKGNLAEKVLITFSPEQAPYIRKIQSGYTQEQLTSGEKYIDSNPEHIGVVNNVVRGEDGSYQLFPRGFVASEHRVNGARMKLEELKGKEPPSWKDTEDGHLVTAMNENTKLGYEPFTIFKDRVGDYAKKRNLKAIYAEVVTDRPSVSGEPIQILSFTPETWKASIRDFAGTGSVQPEPAPFRIALDAATAKTQQEAKAAMTEAKNKVEVEPSSLLLEKTTTEKTDGLRVTQGIAETFGNSLKEAKSPKELIEALGKNGITISEATAIKWSKNPQSVTLNDALVAVKESGDNGNPLSRILYENIIEPYFKSPEAVATPGLKASLEAPILGSKPKKGSYGETLLSPEEEAEMYRVLGGGPEEAFGSQKEVPSLEPPNVASEKPSESPKMPLKASLKPPKTEPPIEPKKPSEETVLEAKDEKMVAKTGETPLQKTEGETRNIPEEDVIIAREQPGEFSKYENNRLDGADRLLVEQRDKFERGSKDWNKFQDARKVLSRNTLETRMKSSAEKFSDESGVYVEKAFEDFSGAFGSWLEGLGVKTPFKNARNRADLFHLFHRTIQSKPRDLLSIKLDKENNSFSSIKRGVTQEPSSFLDDRTEKFNKENKTSLEPLYVEQPKDRKINQSHIIEEFTKNGYVPFGVTGNTRHSYFGVKFDSKVAELYDKNPKRYASKLDEGPLTSDYDKFARVFAVDVLGLGPETTSGEILKRWKIINSHELINAHRENGKVPTYRFIVAESPKFKDHGLLDEALKKGGFLSKEKGGRFFEGDDVAFQEAIRSILEDRSILDGAIFGTERTGRKILKDNGMLGHQTDIKPTTIVELEDGLILQKGNLFILSKAEQKVFETIFNVKLKDGTFLTFGDNIKVGENLLTERKDGHREFEMPATGMRLEYHNPHKETSTFSSSIESKFSVEDGLNGPIRSLFQPRTDQWKSFVKEMKIARTPENIRSIFEKYPEYKITDENFQKKLVNAMNNGAGKRSLTRQLRTQALSILQKKILTGDFIKGDHLKIRPDMGIIKDPATGEARFLKSGEISISRKKWEALGKPKEVAYVRFPVTRKTAIVVAKAIPTEEVALGDNQAVISHYDSSVRIEADYDGDAVTVFKIGGKDGVPRELVKAIETERAEKGDIILSPLSKFQKRPITVDSLNEDASSALLGGEEISKAAAAMRIVNDLEGGNFNLTVEPQGKKRRLTIFAGEKPIWKKTLKGTEKFSGKAKWGDVQNFKAATVSQAAVDSLKSPELAKILKQEGFADSSEYLLSELFQTKDKEILNALRSFQWKLQTPFMVSNRGKPIEDMLTLQRDVKNYLGLQKEIEDAGGKLGPVSEVFSLIDGFEPIVEESTHILYKADKSGVSNVKNYAKNVMAQGNVKEIPLSVLYPDTIKSSREAQSKLKNVKNPKEASSLQQEALVADFIDFVSEKRLEGTVANEKKKMARTILNLNDVDSMAERKANEFLENAQSLSDLRNEVIDEYNRISSNLTNEQRDAVSYWLLTAEEANFKNGIITGFIDPGLPTETKKRLLEGNKEYKKAKELASKDPDFEELLSFVPNLKFEIPNYSNRRITQGAGDVWRLDEIFNEGQSNLARVYYEGFEGWEPTPEQGKKIITDLIKENQRLMDRSEKKDGVQKEAFEKIVKILDNVKNKTTGEAIDILTSTNEILKKLRKKS